MKELKNKKTGIIYIASDEDYAVMVRSGLSSKYVVTDLRMRPVVPTLKHEIPVEIKKIKKKNEG